MNMIRLDAPKRAWTLSDATPDAWLWALGQGTVRQHGRDIEIDAERLASLAESVEAWHPPVLLEHDIEGPRIGEVVRSRVMTRDEAAALGIDQKHNRAMYLGVRWNSIGRDLDAQEQVYYSSVGFALDWEDESGRTWPAALRELSVVKVPRVKSGQIPRPALAGITLSDTEEDIMEDETPEVSTEEAEMAEPTMQALMDEFYRLAAKVDELVALVSEARDDARKADEPMEAEMSDSDAKVVRLSDEVESLRAKLAKRDAADAVRELAAKRVVADPARLVALYLRDQEAYHMLADQLPERPAVQERVAKGGGGQNVPRAQRVRALAESEGITLSDANARIRREEV